ncbi:MAG: polysaccharide-degrading enzyme [Kiritimatiellae bacterium]|nr:polysaccharide-degrading enzyme [Kiritimatiellia bacterium]
MRITTALLVLLHAAAAAGAVYDVGPGYAYTGIGEVPWESLAAGDTVRIHHRAQPYKEKWVICRQGTAEQPIVVTGVPDGGGNLPVIDGAAATTRSALNFWNENRGVIKIGGANTPPDAMPRHIRLENLDITSGRPPYTFTGRDGQGTYSENAAAVYVEKGEHITIRNCILRDCGNGFFCGHEAADVRVQNSYIHANGITNSIYEHNNYTEANGIVFEYNRFGALRDGCGGNNLKDRSKGCVIRYNWIEAGNRQLDLVDSDYSSLYDAPEYRATYVYGNVLIEPDGAGNSQICHYGGDSDETNRYRAGTLYFYNNTVVSTRAGNTTLVRLSTDNETCDCRNNILYTSAAGSYLALLSENGTIRLYNNWIKEGWTKSHSNPAANVLDMAGTLTGTEPGFVDFDAQQFEPGATSSCVDAGGELAADVLPDHNVALQYVKHQSARARAAASRIDIGAFEYADPDAAPPASPRELRVSPR